MQTIRVCLIGAGRAGMVHARNFQFRVPGTEVIAVADPIEAAGKSACEELGIEKHYLDYQELLEQEEFEAAVIASPTKLHLPIARACMEKGIHVLCEKPMAASVEECDEMIRISEENHVKLQIGYMRRHDRSFRAAKEAIEAGQIGDIVAIHSHTRGPSKPHEWMFDVKKNNGTLSEETSHDIDCARWIAGSEIDFLYAVAGNYRNKEVADRYPDFYDNVIITGKFKNGIQFTLEGAQYVQYGHDQHCEVLGTNGTIHICRDSKYDYVAFSNKSVNTPYSDTWIDLFREAYVEEDTHFIKCIREDLTPRVTGYDGKMAVQIVNAGNRSIQTGEVVHLD